MKRRAVAALAVAVLLAVALGAFAAVHGRTGTPRSGPRPAAAAGTSPATARPSASTPPPKAASLTAGAGRFLGVALPGAAADLPRFAAASGTSPNLSEVFTDLSAPFPTAAAQQALAHGAYTLVSWMSQHESLADIAAGRYDPQARAFAAAAKAFAWPVMVDFDHEFNGDWYPWGTQGATPAQFTAAWRHLHQVFTAAGAKNVIWVWSPNVVNPVPKVDLSAYWPGPSYVDVVGIVGYYTGADGEDSYRGLFTRTEDVIGAFADKPFLITEAGAAQGPDKARWVADLLAGAAGDRRMLGLVYFDQGSAQGKRADWTLEDDPAAMAAWRTGAARLRLFPVAAAHS